MADSGGIRAGKAFVELMLHGREKVEQALKSIAGKFQAMGSVLQQVGGAMMGVGAAILGPLAAMTKNFATVGAELDDMSKRTGIAAASLSQLGFAAEQSGTDLGAVEDGVKRMQKTLVDAARGSKIATEALDALGLTAEGLLQLSPEEQFLAIADAISKIEDPTMKAALAMAIFGKSGTDLLPLFEDGAQGIRDMMDEAKDFGIGITNEDVAAAAKLDDALQKLGAVVKGVGVQIGAALAPLAIELVEGLQKAGKVVVDFIRENRGLVVAIAGVGAVIVTVGGAIVGLGLAFSVIAAAAAGFAAAIGAVGTVVAAVSLPVLAAVAGIIALGVAIGVAVAWALKASGAFDNLGAKFGATWKAIVGAVKGGELQLAFQIAVKQIEVVWTELLNALKNKWDDFKNYIAQKFLDIPGAELIFPEGTSKTLDEDTARQKAARDAELDRLRKELADLQKQGMEVGESILPPKGNKMTFVDSTKAVMQAGMKDALTDLQRGTFSGGFAQRYLGLGAVNTKDKTATEKTLKDILDEIKNGEGLAFA